MVVEVLLQLSPFCAPGSRPPNAVSRRAIPKACRATALRLLIVRRTTAGPIFRPRSSARTSGSTCLWFAGSRAAPAPLRDLPGLPAPSRRPMAGGSQRDTVRAAAACGGDGPEDLQGAVLRTAAGGLVGPVRAEAEPGRADERAAACAQDCFAAGRDAALARLRQAPVVASDETGVPIEGANSWHWVFRYDRRWWSITPPRAGLLAWSTRLWPGTGQRCGSRIANSAQ